MQNGPGIRGRCSVEINGEFEDYLTSIWNSDSALERALVKWDTFLSRDARERFECRRQAAQLQYGV